MLNYKKHFPWFKNNKEWVYLDSAATALKPQCVIDAIVDYYTKFSTNTHNNDGGIATKVNDQYLNAHKVVAKFINANSYDEISFNSGATEGLNAIANGLKKKLKKNDEIIIPYSEHASNLLPWLKLEDEIGIKLIFAGKKNSINENEIIKLINKNTKIVSFCNVSNILGYILDEKKIIDAAKKINKNIIAIIDATQSISYKKIDVKKIDCDFLVFSAHKIFSSTGFGVLYGKKHLLNEISAYRLGGGMNNKILTNTFTYAPLPDKFEGGTPNIEGAYAIIAAINFVDKIGIDRIQKHIQELKAYFILKSKEVKNILIFPSPIASSVIAFNIKGIHPQDVSHFLSTQKIITRAGNSCAKLQDKISGLSGFVRISLNVYNDKDDVDKTIDALKKINKNNLLNSIL